MNETEFKRQIVARMSGDFEIRSDHAGNHLWAGELVVPDFLMRPKPHLIADRFDDGWFVVEAKVMQASDATKADTKARDLFWQTLAYCYSDYVVDGHRVRPLFALACYPEELVPEQYRLPICEMRHLVQRGGVGRLVLDPGWAIVFGGSNYFRQRFGRGPHNVGTKRMVGSSR